MTSTRQALEAALVAEPENGAIHAAYADLLIEEGNPRGEYIRLQLAIEDRSQPLDRLQQWTQQAYEIRREHQAEWLGALGPFLDQVRQHLSPAEPYEPNVDVTFRRGWLHRVKVWELDAAILEAIRTCPTGRLLADVQFVLNPLRNTVDALGETSRTELHAWLVSANITNLRRLVLGEIGNPLWNSSNRPGWNLLASCCPRLTELVVAEEAFAQAYLLLLERFESLSSLRLEVLAVPIIWRLLARNASFRRLSSLQLVQYRTNSNPLAEAPPNLEGFTEFVRTLRMRLQHLTLNVPYLSDHHLAQLLASPLIQGLRSLDLSGCLLTDASVNSLIALPKLLELEYLALGGNRFSRPAIEMLQDAGLPVREFAEPARGT